MDIRQIFQNANKTSGFTRFCIIILIIFIYSCFVIYSYGIKNGISITLLTWCFFVYGTPIADAGVLLDFPIKIFTDNPMQRTELYVFAIAAFIIGINYLLNISAFDLTPVTKLLFKMITKPYTLYGIIILLSVIGTYISASLENELYMYLVYKKIEYSYKLLI